MIAPLAKFIDWSSIQFKAMRTPPNGRSACPNWRITTMAIACFAVGVTLSHRVEPGVHVKTMTVAGDIPALQFLPAGPGPHPVALLAHGYASSKEWLFRYGEALAAAGFVCFDVDLPGHGASPRFFSSSGTAHMLEEVARAVGPVDVFVGHSMGGSRGGGAVRDGGLRPKLFIAVGSAPHLGEHGPPLLLLAGRFDEFYPPAVLKARTDARVVLSPWSDHGLELYDPLLVNAAVEAACAAVGKTPPAAPTCWLWRLAGIVLGMLGALGLALCLPKLPPRWAWARGPLVALIFILAFVLTTSTWLDVYPHLRRLPLEIAAAAIALLVLMGAGWLRIPRWSFLALAAVVGLGCLIAGANIPLLLVSHGLVFFLGSIPALLVGTILGRIAAHRGSRRDGDLVMAIIVGCALFQWLQPPRKAPESPKPYAAKPPVAIKLDTKLLDACVGQYRFVPDIEYGTVMTLTIRRQGEQLVGQARGENFEEPINIYPESETDFFDKSGWQFTFIKNDQGEVTAAIRHVKEWPDWEGKKLKN
jgi:pimeloyl-ACP methyl ester carboxylesterase